MSEVGDETCKDYLGLSTYEMLWHEMHKVIETACESMAAAWSPLLDPVPDKLTSEDDIVIMIVDGGREVSIGEYLKEKGLMSDAVGVQPVE